MLFTIILYTKIFHNVHPRPQRSLSVALGSRMGKRPADHPVMAALVDSNWFSATTKEFAAPISNKEPPGNSFFMAPDDMTGTDLIVAP